MIMKACHDELIHIHSLTHLNTESRLNHESLKMVYSSLFPAVIKAPPIITYHSIEPSL